MRIREIDNPETFQRLCQALLVAEYGSDFQVVDDSGGDAGNDGYLASHKTLFAIYCPEKQPTPQRLKKKVVKDLDKVVKLKDKKGYEIRKWIFITPMDLREPMQQFIREQATDRELVGLSMGERHLQDLFLRQAHLHDSFPDLASPSIIAAIAEVKAGQDQIKEEMKRLSKGESAQPSISRSMPDFFPSDDFLRAQEFLSQGSDEEGLTILEKLRLESQDTRERLYATLMIIETLDIARHFDRIHAMAMGGLVLAENLQDHGAIASLKAQIGWDLNDRYVNLDMDTYYRILAGNTTGFPLISEQEKIAIEGRLKNLEEDSRKYFSEAIALARDKRLYRILVFVFCKYANAATGRIIFYQKVPALRDRVHREKEVIHAHYDTAIRIAVALSDLYLLAQCYHDYANDLRMFGELDLARINLKRAQEIAENNGFEDILQSSHELEKRISED